MKHKRNYRQVATSHLRDPFTKQLYLVVVEIDSDGIVDIMGHQAIHSAGHESRACNGDLRVRVFPRDEPSEPDKKAS
jgi:hypothetical protein